VKKPTSDPRTPLSPARRRLYAAITLALPVVFFVLLELGLRLFNYGPDLSLFTTETLHGKSYHIMNPGVKDRYFYRVEFHPTTSPDYFLVPKPPGTFRIFCLGASTTVGFPYYYNASFGTLLRQRLQLLFPEKRIEVINIGMTATNSFTVLDMAREAINYEPDLFVVYDGHNEFYGALGVASRESFGRSRWLASLSLRLIHLRSYLLFRDGFSAVARLFGGGASSEPGIGMMEKLARGQTVRSGSDAYLASLEAFKGNLAELNALTRERRLPLIIATQVSNLRDLKPFVSSLPPGWSPAQRDHFQRLVNAGLRDLFDGRADSAAAVLRRALDLHPGHAEARYYFAQALDRLGRFREAEREYIRARDDDELRFRTSTDFNDAIRALDDGGLTACADMEALFRRESPDSLIGNSLILEHLHPNVRGHFLMAREYARLMRDRKILAPAEEWRQRDTLSEERLWNLRPVTALDERIAERRTEVLTHTWPFAEGIAVVNPIAPTDTLGQIADQVSRARIYWHIAHWEAIRFYERRGDRPALEKEYRALIAEHPLLDVQPYLRLAYLLLEQRRMREVRELLAASLEVTPTILAYRALGDIALRSGNGDAAAAYYEKTFLFPQSRDEEAENGFLLALAYRSSGKTDRALDRLMKVLARKPDFAPAISLLRELRGTESRSGAKDLPAQ
jgi:tetratricopeptide (TPR) repeat protein